MLKLLHTSDWHLGRNLYDFSMLQDQEQFIHKLLAVLEQRPVDAVLIAGDIYDRPVPSADAIALYDFFLSRAVGEMGIPVLAIAGNHDSPGRLQFGSSLYQRSGYHILGSVGSTPHTVSLQDAHGEVHFTLLPWLHLAEVRALFPGERIQTFDDAWRVLLTNYKEQLDLSVRNVAIAHGFFSPIGSALQQQPLLTSDSEMGIGGMDVVDTGHFEGFSYAALGHLHAPQRSGALARYSGSPLKYSLSEEHHPKSVTLVDLDASGVREIEQISLQPLRDVRMIRGTMDQLLEPSFHQSLQFDDYVFADIDGEETPFPMQKLRTLFPHLLGLRFIRHADQAQNPLPVLTAQAQVERQSTEELFCRFYRASQGHDIPAQQLQLLQETLQQLAEDMRGSDE